MLPSPEGGEGSGTWAGGPGAAARAACGWGLFISSASAQTPPRRRHCLPPLGGTAPSHSRRAESAHHSVASVPNTPSSSPSGAILGGVSFGGTPTALPRAPKGNDPLLHDFPASPGANWGGCLCLGPPATRDPRAKPLSLSPLGLHLTGPWGPRLPAPDPTQLGQFHRPVLGRPAPHLRADKKAGDDAAGPEVSPGKGRRGTTAPHRHRPSLPPWAGLPRTPDTCSTASQPAQTAPLSLPGMTCVLAFLHPQGLCLPMPFPLPHPRSLLLPFFARTLLCQVLGTQRWVPFPLPLQILEAARKTSADPTLWLKGPRRRPL